MQAPPVAMRHKLVLLSPGAHAGAHAGAMLSAMSALLNLASQRTALRSEQAISMLRGQGEGVEPGENTVVALPAMK